MLFSVACGARNAALQGPPRLKVKLSKPDHTPLGLFPVHQLWTLALNVQPSAPPAFQGLHAFFPIEGGRIVAYDLTDGTQRWIVPAATTSRPAASADLLFVIEEGAIEALHVADGSSAWKLPFAEPLAAPLVYDNGWLIAATSESAVIAFRASDGHEIWRSQLGSPAHAAPTLADDRVYVPAEDGRVIALRVDDGSTVWTQHLGGAPSEILAAGDRLFVGSKDNTLYCLKTRDGSIDWPVVTGADVIGLPVVDAHNVYFVSLDNVLRAVHRGSGNQEWKKTLAVRPTAGPVQAADAIIVTSVSKTLPAFKATAKGVAAGDLGSGDDIAAPPYVASVPGVIGPVVFVMTNDILKGATVVAIARSIEPLAGPVGILPDAMAVTPTGLVPLASVTPKM